VRTSLTHSFPLSYALKPGPEMLAVAGAGDEVV
jgi:hypothetical protein